MNTYLLLLRAINVSGHNLIKMNDLQEILLNAGFQNIITYIQSGNVIVNTNLNNKATIGFLVQQEIFKKWGFDVPVLVFEKAEIEMALQNNPFINTENIESKKLYFAFISKQLNEQAIHDLKISQVKPDEAKIFNNIIFLKYENGAGKTKLENKYIEKKLNVYCTIRNYNTIKTLFEMLT